VGRVIAPQPDAAVDGSAVGVGIPPSVPATVAAVVASDLPARRPHLATVRVLVSAVAGAVLVGYAAVVALVSLLSTTANVDWSLATTLRSAAPLWLAAHQVPLTITVPGGVPAPLGVLPLLPTLGLAVLVARAAAGVTARLDWRTPAQLGTLAVTFAAAHAAIGTAVAIAEPTGRMTASPAAAAVGCAALSGVAAMWGGLRAAGFSRVALSFVPAWAVRGVLAGLSGLVGLIAAGALCTFGGLLVSAGTARDVLASWSGAPGGEFGVTALSIAYLPNAIVGALSWVAGPGLSIGAVSVTPFGTSVGDLPAVPLLAALPESGPAPWRVMVFVLPVLAGLLVARRCRRLGGDRTERLNAVVVAGAVAAVGCFALAAVAGGRLGGGVFDPVRIPSASLAIAVFVWIVLPAGMVVGLSDRAAAGVDTGVEDPDDHDPEHGDDLIGHDPDNDDPADTLDDAVGDRLGDPGPAVAGADEGVDVGVGVGVGRQDKGSGVDAGDESPPA